jgi:geranylgeranyl transferase type-1 subunit beta
MALGFYCLGTMDVYGMLDRKASDTDRMSWKEWIWEQQAGVCPPFALLCDVG